MGAGHAPQGNFEKSGPNLVNSGMFELEVSASSSNGTITKWLKGTYTYCCKLLFILSEGMIYIQFLTNSMYGIFFGGIVCNLNRGKDMPMYHLVHLKDSTVVN